MARTRECPRCGGATSRLPEGWRRRPQRGYTLVEWMVVLAIAGVLAALATFGVRSQLAAAKTAEAKSTVDAIARAGASGYERARTATGTGAKGGSGAGHHALCTTTTGVPASMAGVKGRTYQPSATEGTDFQTGDDDGGWKCLRFSVTDPIHYQYSYAAEAGDWSGQFTTDYFVARAQGDVDGDGVYARFLLGGQVSGGIIAMQPAIWLQNEAE